jgi:hypothetical protein
MQPLTRTVEAEEADMEAAAGARCAMMDAFTNQEIKRLQFLAWRLSSGRCTEWPTRDAGQPIRDELVAANRAAVTLQGHEEVH